MHELSFGPFVLDRRRLVVTCGEERLALAPKSVELLAVLVERGGEVVRKSELLEMLWPETSVEEANLSQHVYVVRKALRSHASGFERSIVTVPKRGYRFVAPAGGVALQPATPEPAIAQETPAPRLERKPAVRRFSGPAFSQASLRRVGLATFGSLAACGLALVFGVVLASGVQRASHATLSASGAENVRMGWYFLDRRTAAGFRRGEFFFERAVRSDPNHPAAYAGLADAYALSADYEGGMAHRLDYLSRATRFARRALAADPNSAEAHAALGAVAYLGYHDGRRAQTEFERAIALDPSDAAAHLWLGTVRFDRGDFEEANRELALATQLDPGSTAASAWRQTSSYFTRHYDSAIDYGERTFELNPKREDTLWSLGLAYAAKGDYGAAAATFRRISKSNEAFASVPFLLAEVYARAGQKEVARRIMSPAKKQHARDPELAFALLALGDRPGAASTARRVRFESCRDRMLFADDPRFDGVRSDAMFRGILNVSCRASG